MLAKTSARGYGSAHQRLRKQFAVRVERGEEFCRRCGGWIEPKSPWNLGHDDNDRSRWTGPEHERCNKGEPSRRRGRLSALAVPPRELAERWL